jgi:glutamate-ammonia-ligase adenylyltransferase
LTYTDNIRQLEGLAAVGVIDEATAEWLKEAYINYRTVLHHLSLEEEGERLVAAAPYAQTRDRLREIWRVTFESAA